MLAVEQEAIEEPGGMSEMPFGWTDERGGLHHVILHLQLAANIFALLAAGCEDFRQS